MMSLTQQEYLEAAKLVAECKPSKLKYVLEILRQGGIELPDDEIVIIKPKADRKKSVAEMMREEREERYDKRWIKTDDPIILALRNAYLDGYKIADIASAAGITRTALYDYMVGRRQYSARIKAKFIKGFETLGIQYSEGGGDNE